MRDSYHIKRSGLTGHYFVMKRGSVYFATRSWVMAKAVAVTLGSAV